MSFKRNSSIQAVRLVVGRLSPAGAPLVGATNLYVTDQLIKIDYKVQVNQPGRQRLINGSGNACLTFQDWPTIEGVDLGLELCILDAELMEILAGEPIITEGGQPRGNSLPPSGERLDHEVSVEVYSLAVSGDEQATDGGSLIYFHWVWPRTSWRRGDASLSTNPLGVPLVGTGRSNSNFGNGPLNNVPAGSIVGAMGQFETSANLPAITNGYGAIPADAPFAPFGKVAVGGEGNTEDTHAYT